MAPSERRRATEDRLAVGPSFVLRTPLLSWEILDSWQEGGAGGTPDDALRAIASRPEVREALFLASPSLAERAAAWIEDPACKDAAKTHRAVARYVARMATRATQLGLLAGQSVGRFGDQTVLRLGGLDAYRRRARVGSVHLAEVVERTARSAAGRDELRFVPNETIRRVGGTLRYVEARPTVSGHALVSVEASCEVLAVLERAREGAGTQRELVEALAHEGVSREDATAFLDDMRSARLLVPELSVPVTGRDSTGAVRAALEATRAGQDAARALRAGEEEVARLEREPLGASPERYRRIADALGAREAGTKPTRVVSTDLWKPAEMSLDRRVEREIVRGVSLLAALGDRPRDGALRSFREAFSARYDRRAVPLAEALDPETGIGFDLGIERYAEVGLSRVRADHERPPPWSRKHGVLLRKVLAARETEALEIELDEAEIDAMTADDARVEGSFAAFVILGARSAEAVAEGAFQVYVRSCMGPSGARLLGRFCEGSPEIEACTREALRAEEALRPDAVFAEVAYWPGGERANLALRPVLRSYEIPYLGVSSAPPERRIAIEDLWVVVQGGRVVLRSRALGREVVPRWTSPYTHLNPSDPPVFRFLCALQSAQDVQVGWSWGPLAEADFLPRVRAGRVVVTPARWRLDGARVAAAPSSERHRVFLEIARERRLPRWLVIGERDQTMLVDRDNPALVDAALHGAGGANITVVEAWPAPDDLRVSGPEGRFVHEMLVPMTASGPSPAAAPSIVPSIVLTAASSSAPRAFAPGSEWLYVKLFTSAATADDVLLDVVGPIVRDAARAGAVGGWFFLRYSDPEFHLRARFQGAPDALAREVLEPLERATAALLSDGRIARIELGTYEREVERYGGAAGIALSEAIFYADSDASLDLVRALRDGAAPFDRRTLTIVGVDRLLDDLGLTVDEKYSVVERLARARWIEVGARPELTHELGTMYRGVRAALEAALAPDAGWAAASPAIAVPLAARSTRVRAVARVLREGVARAEVADTIAGLASSYAHMHAVRMIRSSVRLHEVVLYDFLRRIYESRRARAQTTRSGG